MSKYIAEVITGKDPIPFEISNGVIKNRPDLMTTLEEADTILIHQVSVIGRGKAVVICDDTAVFDLLLNFVSTGDIKAHVLMQSTSLESNNVTNINATFEKHEAIVPNILAAHALSGCDTVGTYFGIGHFSLLLYLILCLIALIFSINIVKGGKQTLSKLVFPLIAPDYNSNYVILIRKS